ncbi:MAG: hypothetical protein ABEI58_00675 [Candidatus Nanohaloarchaea archaeon]
MEVETSQFEGGVEINIRTDEKVAVVVRTGSGERIYLPGVDGDDSTYYAEDTSGLVETEDGYFARHRGEVKDIEVVS